MYFVQRTERPPPETVTHSLPRLAIDTTRGTRALDSVQVILQVGPSSWVEKGAVGGGAVGITGPPRWWWQGILEVRYVGNIVAVSRKSIEGARAHRIHTEELPRSSRRPEGLEVGIEVEIGINLPPY